MEEFRDFFLVTILESKQKFYEFAIIGELMDLEITKNQLNEIKSSFDFEFDIEIYDDICTFTKYYKYDYIICDFVDEFIFDYHLNPRIAKNGYMISFNEYDLKNNTFNIINNNIFKKITNNELIFYDEETKKFLEEEYTLGILEINTMLQGNAIVVSKMGFDNQNIFFKKNEEVTILAGGVGETIIFLTILEEILKNSRFVSLYIDVRFHSIIVDNFSDYKNKLLLHLDSSYYLLASDVKSIHFEFLSLIRFFRPSVENFKKLILKNNKIGMATALKLPNVANHICNDLQKIKFCGISFGTKTDRSDVNISILDLKKFIMSKEDTIFFIFQYKLEEYEEELELIENDLELKGRVNFLAGLDTENDFNSANTFYSYFDYFISIDNSTMFQFAMSGTDTYYIKRVCHSEEIPSVEIIQHFSDENKWLYFENVKVVYDKDSYRKTLELLFETIEAEQYQSNKKSFFNTEAYEILTKMIEYKQTLLNV